MPFIFQGDFSFFSALASAAAGLNFQSATFYFGPLRLPAPMSFISAIIFSGSGKKIMLAENNGRKETDAKIKQRISPIKFSGGFFGFSFLSGGNISGENKDGRNKKIIAANK